MITRLYDSVDIVQAHSYNNVVHIDSSHNTMKWHVISLDACGYVCQCCERVGDVSFALRHSQ